MIIVELKGGMGNQMFQYAIGRTLSLKNNVSLGLDTSFLLDRTAHKKWKNFVFREYDLDVFNVEARIVTQKEIPFLYRNLFSGKLMLFFDFFRRKILRLKGFEKTFNLDKDILNFKDNSYLSGYWQSPKYFDEYKDIIKKDFTLKSLLSEKSKFLLNEIKSCNSVCVNVRRADFVNNNFHGTMNVDYYHRAIDCILKSSKIDKIYVFSDDIEWCKSNLKFDFPTMFVEKEYIGKKYEEYLFLMSACKYFIIPNSTFAWWAAWLNSDVDKIVVAPKKWFLDEKIDTNDLLPNSWLQI